MKCSMCGKNFPIISGCVWWGSTDGKSYCDSCGRIKFAPKDSHGMYSDQNPKDVAGSKKPPLHLVPPVANIHECQVLQHGADKYTPFNWRQGPKISLSLYIGAMERHIAALKDGESVDPESGFMHLAHIRATTAILLDALSLGQVNDDRPPKGKASEVLARLTKGMPDEIGVE